MRYRMVMSMQRKGTRSRYFVQRIPKDVQPQALGMKLSVPIGGAVQSITITPAMIKGSLRISLRTDDPVTAKLRHAEIVAYLEAIWRSLREDAPVLIGGTSEHTRGSAAREAGSEPRSQAGLAACVPAKLDTRWLDLWLLGAMGHLLVLQDPQVPVRWVREEEKPIDRGEQ